MLFVVESASFLFLTVLLLHIAHHLPSTSLFDLYFLSSLYFFESMVSKRTTTSTRKATRWPLSLGACGSSGEWQGGQTGGRIRGLVFVIARLKFAIPCLLFAFLAVKTVDRCPYSTAL